MFLPPPAKTPLNPSQLAKRRFFAAIPPTTQVQPDQFDGNEQISAAADDYQRPKREMKMEIKNE